MNPTTPTTPSAPAQSGTDEFLKTLQSKLMNQSSIVSSLDTGLEQSIQQAISGVSQAGQATGKRIESQFGREIGYARQDQATAITTEQEGQRGFGVNVAALRQLTQTTDKQINDLESRKQEALLANDAATASKIGDLQLQALEFRQRSQQNVFNNLLSMSNFALNVSGQEEQRRQFNTSQSFQEKSAMVNLATQFGVAVKEGDTLDTISARVAPFASQKQQLEIAKMRADINNSNAQARRALQGDTVPSLDKGTISLLAEQALINPSILGGIKDAKQLAQIQQAMQGINKSQYTGEGLKQTVTSMFQSGMKKTDIRAQVSSQPYLNATEIASAIKAIDELEAQRKKQEQTFKSLQRNNAPSFQMPVFKPTGFFGGNRGVAS